MEDNDLLRDSFNVQKEKMMTNKQLIKKHYTGYGKLLSKICSHKEKRRTLQRMKKAVRFYIDEQGEMK